MNRTYAYLRDDRKIKFRKASVQHFITKAPEVWAVITLVFSAGVTNWRTPGRIWTAKTFDVITGTSKKNNNMVKK